MRDVSFFTESPQYQMSYSLAANQTLSKFLASNFFDGEVIQDSGNGGLTRIVFSKKSISVSCFLFASFVQWLPACPSVALEFCKKRFLLPSESDECVELVFPGMNECSENTNESCKCYLLKTQRKVYLAMTPQKRNNKAIFVDFVDFSLTGG